MPPIYPALRTRVISESGFQVPQTKSLETGLPYAWNWHTGEYTIDTGKGDPKWQAVLIAAGDKIAPSIKLDPEGVWAALSTYTLHGINAVKDINFPVVFKVDDLFYDIYSLTEFSSEGVDPNVAHDDDPHGWWVYDNAGTPTTVTTLISPFSRWCIDYAYRLGYLYGTCDQIVQSAIAYPEPPVVVVIDDEDVGLDWQNALGPDLREYWARHGEIRNAPGIMSAHGEQWLGNNIENTWFDDFYSLARKRVFNEFTRGWKDGLKSHSEHWCFVAGFVSYEDYQREFSGGSYQVKIGGAFVDRIIGDSNPNLEIGDHNFGATGKAFLDLGDWSKLRSWGQFSNERAIRDLIWYHEGHRGNDRGVNVSLCNEGISSLPTATQWLAFARTSIWLSHVGTDRKDVLCGHYISESSDAVDDEFTIYYEKFIDAVNEIHSDSVLKDFWTNGRLSYSIDPSPYMKSNYHHMYLGLQWFFQHVTDNNRYVDPLPAISSALEMRYYLEDLDIADDNWKSSSDNLISIPVVVWSVKKDDELLIFAAGVVANETDVEVKIPVDHPTSDTIKTFTISSAPLGGMFYLADLTADTIVAI